MLAEKYVDAINHTVTNYWETEEKDFIKSVEEKEGDTLKFHVLLSLITLQFMLCDEIEISKELADAILESGVEVGDLKFWEFDEYCNYDEYADIPEDVDHIKFYIWKP